MPALTTYSAKENLTADDQTVSQEGAETQMCSCKITEMGLRMIVAASTTQRAVRPKQRRPSKDYMWNSKCTNFISLYLSEAEDFGNCWERILEEGV